MIKQRHETEICKIGKDLRISKRNSLVTKSPPGKLQLNWGVLQRLGEQKTCERSPQGNKIGKSTTPKLADSYHLCDDS